MKHGPTDGSRLKEQEEKVAEEMLGVMFAFVGHRHVKVTRSNLRLRTQSEEHQRRRVDSRDVIQVGPHLKSGATLPSFTGIITGSLLLVNQRSSRNSCFHSVNSSFTADATIPRTELIKQASVRAAPRAARCPHRQIHVDGGRQRRGCRLVVFRSGLGGGLSRIER